MAKKLTTEKELLLKRAFKFGYEVGYYRHYENLGWVRETKQQLFKKAAELNIVSKTLVEYKRGKLAGAKARETSGKSIEAVGMPSTKRKVGAKRKKLVTEESVEIITVKKPKEKLVKIIHEKSEDRKELDYNINRGSILSVPQLITTPRIIHLPGILRFLY